MHIPSRQHPCYKHSARARRCCLAQDGERARTMKRDAQVTELMDIPTLGAAELRGPLADLRHINWLLGWTRFAVRAVARQVAGQVEQRPGCGFSLLDIASGSGDIPIAIARWALRKGIAARIVATDVHPSTVAVARAHTAALPNIHVEAQDALRLPYPTGSFDIALCTLALHHFAPDDAVVVLRNLGRVGRKVLVFDLVRSPVAYIGALLLTRLGRMDRITRHDGPASVRRAYTKRELREMAERAHLRHARVSVRFPYRLLLQADGDVTGDA